MDTTLISLEDKYNLLTGRIFMYVNRFLTQQFRLNKIELSREQWTVLVQLWKKDGISQQVIADETGRDKPSTTRLIDRLEKDGYINRVADNNDRRSNLIFLTDKGKKAEKEAMDIANQVLHNITKELSEQEMQTVKSVFMRIYKNLEI